MSGQAGHGMTRLGQVRQGLVWLGQAGVARLVVVGPGKVRLGKAQHGMAGMSRRVSASRGMAGQG